MTIWELKALAEQKAKDEQLTTEVNSKASETSVTALQGLVDNLNTRIDGAFRAEGYTLYLSNKK